MTRQPEPLDQRAIRVLLFDDDDALRQTTAAALRRRGFDVAGVGSRDQAVEQLTEQPPDVVVIDLHARSANSIGALRHIRARGGHMPVLLLTGGLFLGETLEAFQRTDTDFLFKPVDVERLSARIRSVVSASSAAPSAAPSEQRLTALMVPLSAYRRVPADAPAAVLLAQLREVIFDLAPGGVARLGRRSVLVYDGQQLLGPVNINDVLITAQQLGARAPVMTLAARGEALCELKARDFVQVIATIDGEASLLKALRTVIREQRPDLLVSLDGEPVGILRDSDLFMELARAVQVTGSG